MKEYFLLSGDDSTARLEVSGVLKDGEFTLIGPSCTLLKKPISLCLFFELDINYTYKLKHVQYRKVVDNCNTQEIILRKDEYKIIPEELLIIKTKEFKYILIPTDANLEVIK